MVVGDFNGDGVPDLVESTDNAGLNLGIQLTQLMQTATDTLVGATAGFMEFGLTNNSGAPVSNAGNATLHISSITVTGANAASFWIPGDHQLCKTVAAASSCTFDVAFRPTAAGVSTASINIADNTSASPQAVAVSGTAD